MHAPLQHRVYVPSVARRLAVLRGARTDVRVEPAQPASRSRETSDDEEEDERPAQRPRLDEPPLRPPTPPPRSSPPPPTPLRSHEQSTDATPLAQSLNTDDLDSAPPRAARAPARAERAPESAGCPICLEEQASGHDAAAPRGADATAAVAAQIADCRSLVFAFEAHMRGRMRDDEVLPVMLSLRRALVEAPLAAHGLAAEKPWTLAMLRAHYNPRDPHRFDIHREIDDELRATRRACHFLDDFQMYVSRATMMGGLDPADGSGGGGAAANGGAAADGSGARAQLAIPVRVADLRLRMGRFRADLAKQHEAQLARSAGTTSAADAAHHLMQSIVLALRATGGAATIANDAGGAVAPAIRDMADANLTDMYDLTV